MEILQLRYFYESAINQSFSKTAEKYMVPLTSVSASIKRLENELNCTLFNRYSNRIELNENGKKLQNSLCMIFDELNNVVQSLSPKTEDKQEIKISVRAIRNEIAEHIIEYSAMHPNVSFKTIFNFTDENMDDYDIIIDDKSDSYINYENFEFCNRRIFLLVSFLSPLAGKKLRLKELWNQPFISTGENTNTHKMLLKACRNEGFTPNFVIHTNDLLCYNKYIEAGVGIGVGRTDTLESKNNSLTALDVTDFIARQSVYVFYKTQTAQGNIKDFLQFLKSKAL